MKGGNRDRAKGLDPERIRAASERFHTKYTVCESGCWEWNGYRMPKGYGRFSVANMKIEAHRVSYIMHHGPVPEGLHVMHSCDNAPCVNPAHLSVGTAAQNVADQHARGRARPAYSCNPPNPERLVERKRREEEARRVASETFRERIRAKRLACNATQLR